MKIAFLGVGKMGGAIARLLVKSGDDVTVWNRTAARTEPLVQEGARRRRVPAMRRRQRMWSSRW